MSFQEIKRDDIAEVVLVLLTERSMKAVREDSNGNDTPLLPYTRAIVKHRYQEVFQICKISKKK